MSDDLDIHFVFRTMARVKLATLLVLASCGQPVRPVDSREIENAELLVDTAIIGGDFTARHSIEARFGERRAIFQAILQKTGDRLIIVGLTPQGQRAFVLQQRGREVEYDQAPGVELPFSPWHILVDIHRGLFRGGGPSPAPRPDGEHHVAHPLEPMVETWSGGSLTRRVIAIHGVERGAVVEYAPGSGPLYARSLRFRNLRVGYTLRISPL